jgi:hypothetical protein
MQVKIKVLLISLIVTTKYKTTSNITNTNRISDDDKIDDTDDDSKLPPQMQTPNPQVLVLL